MSPRSGDLLTAAARRLRDAGIESPRREARLLLAHALGVRSENGLADDMAQPPAAAAEAFERLLVRRERREPLAYILGTREFWSLPFRVVPGVLIPRPDSETLVEEALKRFPERDAALSVLDLGTGSGCLLLSFLSERPLATGLGVDLSDIALATASGNADRLGLAARCRFMRSDWAHSVEGRFDVVFVNPPYVAESEFKDLEPDVALYEPATALGGGPDGLACYRRAAESLAGKLSEHGLLFFELGHNQSGAVSEILTGLGWRVHGTVADLAGIPRCMIASLRETIVPKSPVPKKELAIPGRTD